MVPGLRVLQENLLSGDEKERDRFERPAIPDPRRQWLEHLCAGCDFVSFESTSWGFVLT